MRVLLVCLLLAACAGAPPALTMPVTDNQAPPPAATVHVTARSPLFKSDPTVAELPAFYEDTWSAQRDIIATPNEPAGIVHGLRRVDNEMRAAIKPLQERHHTPTPDEVGRAIVALSALKTYLALEAPAPRVTGGPKKKK